MLQIITKIGFQMLTRNMFEFSVIPNATVKLLKSGEDAVNKALLRQEVSVWRELNHPNVTKVKIFIVDNV